MVKGDAGSGDLRIETIFPHQFMHIFVVRMLHSASCARNKTTVKVVCSELFQKFTVILSSGLN
jgi:hypothetical protein